MANKKPAESSTETDKKLEAYLDIIASGEVPPEKIADLAEVPIEAVRSFIAKLTPDKPPAGTPPVVETPANSPPPGQDSQSSEPADRETQLTAWEERLQVREAGFRERTQRLEDGAAKLQAWELSLSRREEALAQREAAAGAPPQPPKSYVVRIDDTPAPPTVRALRKAKVLDAEGRPWRIGTKDVFSGERAAFLWNHHLDLVEAYSPRLSE